MIPLNGILRPATFLGALLERIRPTVEFHATVRSAVERVVARNATTHRVPSAPTGRQHTSPGQRRVDTAALESKAPTGRPYDSPGQRPGSHVPIESGALKGRNMGGAA
jgi:hypothetical protein